MEKFALVIVLVLSPVVRAGLRKCCPPEKVLNLHTKKCVNDSSHLNEEFAMDVTIVAENRTIKQHLTLETTQLPDAYLCKESLRYNFEPIIAKIGSSYAIVDGRRPERFEESSACIDHALNTKTSEITVVAQACLPCSEEDPCINYCCPGGQVSKDGVCVPDKIQLRSPLTNKRHQKVSLQLHCVKPDVYPKNLWYINSKGDMIVDGKVHDASEYCIEDENEDGPSLLLCSMLDDPVDYKRVIKMVFMCLSLGSILVIIFFHIFIEDIRTNRFTKLKLPLYTCLFISFLIIIITSFIDFTGTSSCVVLALVLQYFSLSIFFWLTSMSFDIWLGFRIIANPLQNQDSAQQRLRLGFLYVFSVGSPLVITVLTGFLQLLSDPEHSSYTHPSIGVSCMIGQYLPRFLYFHLIIFTLLCVNCVFYCLVVFNFSCGIWNQCRYGRNHLRNFRVLVELIFLMGITWFSEIVSFLIGWQYASYWDHPVLSFINSINWIIGVIILLLFICKPSNRKLVRKIFLPEEGDVDLYMIARTFSSQLSESNRDLSN